MFRQGDLGRNWYAVLNGSLDVLVARSRQESEQFCTLGIGSVFGESVLNDGRRQFTVVTKERCELLRVEARDFKHIWENNKTYMEEGLLPLCSLAPAINSNRNGAAESYPLVSGHCQRSPPPGTANWNQVPDAAIPYSALPITEPSKELIHCARVLSCLIESKSLHMIRDRKYHMRNYRRCLVGVEMVDWLLNLGGVIHLRSQAVMAWQALLEEGIIFHVNREHHFKDKYQFYRFHDNVLVTGSRTQDYSDKQDVLEAEAELPDVLGLLLHCGPDAMLRMILRKPRYERTIEDVEIVNEELIHIKALSHLSHSVKLELATFLTFEAHPKAGEALFYQGDEGSLWYIILKGSVDVVIHGKGVVCSLYEGDDFGKLALVNDAPRAATIVLREDNCQFLSVDKEDFNRILRDVEANTIRLKEHDQDVLILQKIPMKSHTPDSPQKKYRYFVIAGTPQKILEHLLETCLDVKSDDVEDTLLEDFLYTHVIFMPYHQLCPELMKFYLIESSGPTRDREYVSTFKKKVVLFLHTWVYFIGDSIFQVAVLTSLVEDMVKVVQADQVSYGNLHGPIDMLSDIMAKFERFLSKGEQNHKTWELLPTGHIVPLADIEDDEHMRLPRSPMRITDNCLFRVYCADHTYCTLKLLLGTTAERIKQCAAEKMGFQDCAQVLLIEVKSDRGTFSRCKRNVIVRLYN